MRYYSYSPRERTWTSERRKSSFQYCAYFTFRWADPQFSAHFRFLVRRDHVVGVRALCVRSPFHSMIHRKAGSDSPKKVKIQLTAPLLVFVGSLDEYREYFLLLVHSNPWV